MWVKPFLDFCFVYSASGSYLYYKLPYNPMGIFWAHTGAIGCKGLINQSCSNSMYVLGCNCTDSFALLWAWLGSLHIVQHV